MQTMMLKILTRTPCVQCTATKRKLANSQLAEGTDYVLVTVDDDPEAFELGRELGYLQAPVCLVYVDGALTGHWSGFDPNRLDAYIQAQTRAA